MNGSILLELHPWKGFAVERELFAVVLVCGWFSLLVCRLSVIDKLRDFTAKLKEVKELLGGER